MSSVLSSRSCLSIRKPQHRGGGGPGIDVQRGYKDHVVKRTLILGTNASVSVKALTSSRRQRDGAATLQQCQAAAGSPPAGDSSGDSSTEPEPQGLVAKVKNFFLGGKLDKARIAKLGTSALLSYGAISNINSITLVIFVWVTFASSTGLSPLAAGQWPKFLASYAATYAVIGNLLRPLRFTLAVAVTPFFDRLVLFFQNKFNVRPAVAFGLCVFCVNVCGSFTYLFLGLRLATLITGTPLFA